MIDIELKRDFVRNMYYKSTWKKRVDRMDDAQIVAIYIRKHQAPKAKEAKRNLDKDNPPF